MPQFQTTRRVRHSAQQMFDLVADIERYPEFVPLCSGLRVRRRSTDAAGREVIVADMTVAYKMIRESFTSEVTLDRDKLAIGVRYLNGPFSALENRWNFKPEGDDACDVVFFIAYEFKSRMFAMLMGAMFDAAFRRFSKAFEDRADRVYGRGALASGT
jgi:coenzyme Q-binding protein COQ10